jgi:pilus assembly protein Flp/PilA
MLGIARRFLANRSGATAIEYALIAGLIAVVIAGAVGALGAQLSSTYNSVTALFPAS